MILDLNRTKPDRNFRSESGKFDVSVVNQNIYSHSPQEYDDILKFSHTIGALVKNCTIGSHLPSREDGVDINKCEAIYIMECKIWGGDKYGITIKGGSKLVSLEDVQFMSYRRGIDVDIGNFSDTNMDKTTGVVLRNVTRGDGNPVRVRVGRGNKPTIIGGNVKILFWHSLALKAYVLFKHYYLRITKQ